MSVWLLGGTQILSNPDFECGSITDWAVTGSSVALDKGASSADQFSGNYSALVTCTSGLYYGVAGPRIYQEDIALEAGRTYFARCAIKVASGTLDSADTTWSITYGLSTYAEQDICVSSLWKTFGMGWRQTTAVNSIRLNILLPRFDDPPPNAGIFFDDIEIYRAVELGADYGYKFGKVQRRTDVHDRSGGLQSYILPGGYRRFEFPGINVNSAGRCAINSFWVAADTCYLIENDSDPTSMYAVKVMEIQEPFQSFAEPYGLARYIGDLVLETVDAE